MPKDENSPKHQHPDGATSGPIGNLDPNKRGRGGTDPRIGQPTHDPKHEKKGGK